MPYWVMEIRSKAGCVLLAGRHHGLSEGIRGLLKTVFEVVVMVADEMSMLESAKWLPAKLAVLDLSLAREGGFKFLHRLRQSNPALKVIVISAHDQSSVGRSALKAGANGFVLQRSIATDLLPAVDAVRAGRQFLSPSVSTPVDLQG
jgi:DNA-binding NarL/FixJ family response regulator